MPAERLARLSILNVGQNYRIVGGSDVYSLALEHLLNQHGHETVPFAASHPQNLPSEWNRYFPLGADFEHPGFRDLIRYIYSFPAYRKMQAVLNDKPIDLAHLHIYYGKLTSSILLALKERDLPVVQTLHEYKIVCPTYRLLAHRTICQACNGRQFYQAILKRCNRGSLARSTLSALESYVSRAFGNITKVDHFIAVSDFLRNKVVELGLPAEKVTTIHNFIDARTIKSSRATGEYFLYFGRIERVKGLFTLVEAFRPLRDMQLVLAGNGTAFSELKYIIESEGLDHIRMVGFKQGGELEALIRGSICTITPSQWYETFGLTLIESFAHGRPVIASCIGGMTEVVSDGEDGYLVPPGDCEALRDKILWMAENKVPAAEMGMMGRKKVEMYFNPETHYAQIREVYRKVLGR